MWLVASFFEEPYQVFAPDRRCCRVFHRVTINNVILQERVINENRYVAVVIIHDSKRCDGTRRNAKPLHKQVRFAEAQARAADRLVQCLHVDNSMAFGDNEEQSALGVLQEQVFGMPAWKFLVQRVAFGNREDGGVLFRFGLNRKCGEAREEVLSRGRHEGVTTYQV